MVVAGLVSFGLALGLFSFILKEEPQEVAGVDPTTMENAEDQQAYGDPLESEYVKIVKDRGETLTEKQMKSLIIDLKQRRKEYDDRDDQLSRWEENLKVTEATLKKDLKELEDLRLKIVTSMADFKIHKKLLDDSILEIEQVERDNLIWRASVYDKMDSVAASKIFLDMSKNDQLQDAAKVLHYMTERNAAKLLAEIANKDSEITSALNLELKRIKEQSI